MSSLAVIIPSVLPIPFGQAKDQGYSPLDWNLVERIESEADSNDTVGAALSILMQTTFRGGITLTFSAHGNDSNVDPWFEENILALEWQPMLEKMLKHFVYFGFAVVTYVRSHLSGEMVPQVLDTCTYTMYFRYDEHGARHYIVYPLMPGPGIKVRDPGTPLENVRIFFSNEPDALGRITSNIKRILPSLLAVEQLQTNMLDADRERTHPAFVYEHTSSRTTAAMTAGDVASISFSENSAMVHDRQVRGQVSATDRLESALAVAEARRSNAVQARPVFDKRSGSVMMRVQPMPWEKYTNVPADHALKQPPVPQLLPTYIETQRVYSSRIALACGVPLPLLGEVGGGAGSSSSSAGFENSLGVLRDHVLVHQQRLSIFVSTMYIDIYHDVHQEDFERDISTFQKKINRLLTDDEMIVLQRRFFVRARFKSPPAFRFDDVLKLRGSGVISRDTMQRLALGVFNLPIEMALSEKEEEREREREARLAAADAAATAEATAAVTGGVGTGGGGSGGGGEGSHKRKTKESTGGEAASSSSSSSAAGTTGGEAATPSVSGSGGASSVKKKPRVEKKV